MAATPAAEASVVTGTGEESAAAEEQTKVKRGVEYYFPPLQVHVILAGLAVSLGLAAIGLSFRAGSISVTATASDSIDIHYALAQNMRPADPNQPAAPAAQMTFPDDPRPRVDVKRPPVSRFWLLGALVGLATALTGWWVLAQGMETWQPNELWRDVAENAQAKEYRKMAHVVMGVGMVVLMLLLALVARVAAGRKIVVAIFVFLFLGSVAAQMWLGSLLMFDTPGGSVMSFNSSEAPAEPPTSAPTGPIDAPVGTPTTGPATTTTTTTASE